MLVRKLSLSDIDWQPQEEASATDVVKEVLRRTNTDTIQNALSYGAAMLGFNSYLFAIVANDRRPDAESRVYTVNNQAESWVRQYDECAYVDLDPRIEIAAEPGCGFWEGGEFTSPRHQVFLRPSAAFGIRSGLVVGLCTRDPPSYAMLAFNRAAPTLAPWNAGERLMIAGQVSILGRVLSRTVRRFLNEQELLFPAPRMRLNSREREILTLAAAGKTSKEIAAELGIARVTVDVHVGTILSKMGALNRNQAIAKAISTNLIKLPDDGGYSEYKSAKLQATRKAPKVAASQDVERTLLQTEIHQP